VKKKDGNVCCVIIGGEFEARRMEKCFTAEVSEELAKEDW